MTTSFEIAPMGHFSLGQAISFGFGPTPGDRRSDTSVMRMAFCTDGHDAMAGVTLRQAPSGVVRGEVQGVDDAGAVRGQVSRILSLDHDGERWPDAGERDPVLGALQAAYPGFRPVLFHSPYEAAAWAILATRRPASQARQVRRNIAEELGAIFDLDGERVAAFPPPRWLAEIQPMPGVDPRRAERLRAVASAALDGRLDPDALRTAGPEEAAASVRAIPGIGEFYSGLIAYRSVGFVDALNARDPSSLQCAGHFYGTAGTPTPQEFLALADRWRPFRSWGAVLLRQAGFRDGVTRR